MIHLVEGDAPTVTFYIQVGSSLHIILFADVTYLYFLQWPGYALWTKTLPMTNTPKKVELCALVRLLALVVDQFLTVRNS